MKNDNIWRHCANLADAAEPFVVVTIAEATGSTPQDGGAKMLVTADGLRYGTVGGGRVEAKALAHAQGMLGAASHDNAEKTVAWVDWNLKADVGMTCGGRVKLLFEKFDGDAWDIVVFGAGHVAQALARLLVSLPCRVTCIDPRPEWMSRLPKEVRIVELADPREFVDQLPSGAFILCMTQGHRSDFPVLERLFSGERSFPFVGVIGSKAKAAVLRKELVDAGIDASRTEFHCPVGLPLGTNHPGEIAVSIAAQLLQVRDAKKLTT